MTKPCGDATAEQLVQRRIIWTSLELEKVDRDDWVIHSVRNCWQLTSKKN